MSEWQKPDLRVHEVVAVDRPAVTLIEFLRARLDEDEGAALRADDDEPVDSDNQARWSRSRVLAEVEAKRRIIAECERTFDVEEHGWALANDVLALLALPYADHPDYDQAWKF